MATKRHKKARKDDGESFSGKGIERHKENLKFWFELVWFDCAGGRSMRDGLRHEDVIHMRLSICSNSASSSSLMPCGCCGLRSWFLISGRSAHSRNCFSLRKAELVSRRVRESRWMPRCWA